MTRKRITAICLVFVFTASLLLTTAACTKQNGILDVFENGNGTGTIISDGKKFPSSILEATDVLPELPEGEDLPIVGDLETLLKLLFERGALYDDTEFRLHSSDEIPVLESEEFAITESVPAPAAPAMDAPLAAPAESDTAMAGGDGGASHSETNEQVAGVNEGDIVKTDGRYLYAMSQSDNRLRIISANGADLEVVSTISFGDVWGSEFYLIGNDRLAVIGNEHVMIRPLPADIEQPAARIAPPFYGHFGSSFTTLTIYDITDKTAPNELRRVSMDGWGVSTRVIDGIVYLVTTKHLWGIPLAQADSPFILPYTRDTAESEEFEPLSFDSIRYVPGTHDTSYLLIGAIDVYSDDAFEPKAYLGAGSNLYMSRNAMYITQYRWVVPVSVRDDNSVDIWNSGSEKTEIMRFTINGTNINYAGKGMVDGSPINQYSMDEHKGYFRIATTDWSAGTYVTVLDTSNMQTVGRTEPLAPGEIMHSMRFMGDMGYVVTFLNVDPLFTIDLSDPYNPKMLGELKIPGFSQYLHPVGDGLLLGIGRDTQEIYTRDENGVETVVGFNDVGMRVTLFDVKNPFDPKEVDVLKLGEGWTEVSFNPRALMADSSRGLYGFIAETWDFNRGGNVQFSGILLSVNNERLTVAATVTPDGFLGSWGSRLCFIGNTLYFVHQAGIIVYDYNSFEEIGSISF